VDWHPFVQSGSVVEETSVNVGIGTVRYGKSELSNLLTKFRLENDPKSLVSACDNNGGVVAFLGELVG